MPLNPLEDSDEAAYGELATNRQRRPWSTNSVSLCYGTNDEGNPTVRDQLLNERMRALFDEVDVHDNFTVPRRVEIDKGAYRGFTQWEAYGPPAAGPFEVQPTQFLSRARERRPSRPEATASAFANWVYSLYGRVGDDEDAMNRGLDAERTIWRLGQQARVGARAIWTAAGADVVARRGDGWSLVHQGLHLTGPTVPFFEIADLQVLGAPMRASPDLIFRNSDTEEVRVVDIKLSRQSLPANLWPNVWAQLWVYSHIPIVRNAPKTLVAAEVWGEKNRPGTRTTVPHHLLYLRAVVRRDPRAPAYARFFQALFDIYRGADTSR